MESQEPSPKEGTPPPPPDFFLYVFGEELLKATKQSEFDNVFVVSDIEPYLSKIKQYQELFRGYIAGCEILWSGQMGNDKIVTALDGNGQPFFIHQVGDFYSQLSPDSEQH